MNNCGRNRHTNNSRQKERPISANQGQNSRDFQPSTSTHPTTAGVYLDYIPNCTENLKHSKNCNYSTMSSSNNCSEEVVVERPRHRVLPSFHAGSDGRGAPPPTLRSMAPESRPGPAHPRTMSSNNDSGKEVAFERPRYRVLGSSDGGAAPSGGRGYYCRGAPPSTLRSMASDIRPRPNVHPRTNIASDIEDSQPSTSTYSPTQNSLNNLHDSRDCQPSTSNAWATPLNLNKRNDSRFPMPSTSNASRTPNANQGQNSRDFLPSTSTHPTTAGNHSTERNDGPQNVNDAINAGLAALTELGRANFESGVHFCPPHFFDHKFFTEEMALAYRSGNFGDGPLRNFQGKIWEELIYHGLKENLPDLRETSSILSMWVFSGLDFALNSELLSRLSINVQEETEIDLLVVGLTETGQLFLVPIEIKKTKSDGKAKIVKASDQCRKYTERLSDVLKVALQRNEVGHFIRPVIFRCHKDQSLMQRVVKNFKNRQTFDVTFDVYLNKYKEFKIQDPFQIHPKSLPKSNFFSWLSHMEFESENSNCDSSDYQRLIGLLVFISSCKTTIKKSHDATTCYNHLKLGGIGICMKGTMLCPKYIHEYVVKNIEFLTYLRTFYVKNNTESIDSDAFQAYSINKLPTKLMKIVQKYLKNITNEQLKALMREDKRVVLFGDYGAGKTLVLIFKAMEILIKIENGEESGRIRFMSKEIALKIDVIAKFRAMFSEETLAKYVTFQSWEEFSKEDSISEEFCFFDEAEDTRDSAGVENVDSEKPHFKTISRANANTRLIWVVIASTYEHKHFEKYSELNGFVFHDLSWQLRNSHSTSYFSKIMRTGNDDETVRVSYPIYGARSRMHWYESEPNEQERIIYFVNEVEYWLGQMKKGSILMCGRGYDNYQAKKEKIRHQFDVELEDLRERTSCDSGKENIQDIRIFYTNNDDHMSGLEFDIVIFDEYWSFWKIFSRGKYGISWSYRECGKRETVKIEHLSRWGRCEVIKHRV